MSTKIVRFIFVPLLLTVFCFGVLLISPASPRAHAATLHGQTATATTTEPSLQQPAWITKADPYIHIVNGQAVIDPQLSSVLTPSEFAQVKQSVQRYNQLPLSVRAHPIVSAKTSSVSPQWSWCYPGWSAIRWWGIQYYLTSCRVQEYLAGSSLFTLFGPIPGGVAVVNGFFVWLVSINSCNGSVYIDINWFGMPAYVPGC